MAEVTEEAGGQGASCPHRDFRLRVFSSSEPSKQSPQLKHKRRTLFPEREDFPTNVEAQGADISL